MSGCGSAPETTAAHGGAGSHFQCFHPSILPLILLGAVGARIRCQRDGAKAASPRTRPRFMAGSDINNHPHSEEPTRLRTPVSMFLDCGKPTQTVLTTALTYAHGSSAGKLWLQKNSCNCNMSVKLCTDFLILFSVWNLKVKQKKPSSASQTPQRKIRTYLQTQGKMELLK